MKKKTKLMAIAIAIVILASPLVVFKITNLQNNKPQTSAPDNSIRVACVGDSITEISGYPSDLQLLLGDNYTVGNFGVTGSTVSLSS